MLLANADDLREEIKELIKHVPVLDHESREYVSGVLAFPLTTTVEEIRMNNMAAYNSEVAEHPERKLRHFTKMSERCLCAGAFYLDEMEKDRTVDEVGLMQLGKAGYRAAAMHCNIMGNENPVYQRLSEVFLQIVAYVNPLMKKFLDGRDAVPRLVYWTPQGERILRANYSGN